MDKAYLDFLERKKITVASSGFEVEKLNPMLYEYQRDIVKWGLRRGKAAFFTMTGTGKTPMQFTWADEVCKKTGGNVLILAPLAVSMQTVRMAEQFGVKIEYVRSQEDIQPGINIANYEMLHVFSPENWSGIVLDESGILKSFVGKTRNAIIDFAQAIHYRLACTATPAPNDYVELGNHAEFLGIMSYNEMLATFFVHDGGETAKWRLKGHAQEKFWEWVASWGVFLTKPSDLGYSDEGFELPPLHTHEHIVKSDAPEGELFPIIAATLSDRLKARRESLERRVQFAVDLVKEMPKPVLLWCNLNDESALLKKLIPGSVEVKGADGIDHKEHSMLDFADGGIDVMISKSDICGFGMNFQACCNTIFVGINDSFEQMFQATKRFHRQGQKNDVNRHIIVSEAEGSVLRNIQRKEREFEVMVREMVKHTQKITMKNIHSSMRQTESYHANEKIQIPEWLKSEGANV